MKKNFFRVAVITLALVMVFSSSAFIEPALARNSGYIDSYCAYLYSPGDGIVQVWFELKANRTSDKVGAQTIFLQVSDNAEDWTNLQTFRYAYYPHIMASNTISHCTYVEASVETGHYYRACLTLYVEKDGGSDSRFYVTDAYWI